MSTDQRPVEILLVEDSEPDVRLTREALRECRIINRLHLTRDGTEAMAFLHRRGLWADAPRPDLILMDLNLPRMGGHDVLSAVKADDALRTIPVVILTSSSQEEDVLKSYKAHASAYIRKPLNPRDFFEIFRMIEDFWFHIIALPPSEDIAIGHVSQT